MRLISQRWSFRIGNTLVHADNAFSWTMWGQERLLVNDEPAHLTGGRLRISARFREPWLTPLGDGLLQVHLRSNLKGFICTATLEGEAIPLVSTLEATWRGGRHSWPDQEAWSWAGPHGWVADVLPRPAHRP